MTDRDIMQQALEALQEPHPGIRTSFSDAITYREKLKQAIIALRDRLAQPEQIDWEGVAADQAMTIALLKSELQEFADKEADAVEVALTESGWIWDGDQWQRPAQRKPLSDEQLEAMAEKYVTNCYFDTLKYARAIEAAHGIEGEA